MTCDSLAAEAITPESFIAEAINLQIWTLPGQIPDSTKEITIEARLEKNDGASGRTLGGLTIDRASITGASFNVHVGAWLRDDLKTIKMSYRLGHHSGGLTSPVTPEHFSSVGRTDEPNQTLAPSQVLLTFPDAGERLALTVKYKKST